MNKFLDKYPDNGSLSVNPEDSSLLSKRQRKSRNKRRNQQRKLAQKQNEVMNVRKGFVDQMLTDQDSKAHAAEDPRASSDPTRKRIRNQSPRSDNLLKFEQHPRDVQSAQQDS